MGSCDLKEHMTTKTTARISPIRKTITACTGALAASLPLIWDLSVSEDEALSILVAWATAFGVWKVENT